MQNVTLDHNVQLERCSFTLQAVVCGAVKKYGSVLR